MQADYTFEETLSQEDVWWDFLSDSGLTQGDLITFKTTRTQRVTPLKVLEVNMNEEITVETDAGTVFRVVTEQLHPLEPVTPMIRDSNDRSHGPIEQFQVYKLQ